MNIYPERRSLIFAIIILSIIYVITSSATEEMNVSRETLFQVSTIGSLLAGNYDGLYSFEDLAAKGDTGVGTFHSLDGEMIALDGKYFQVRVDGTVHEVKSNATSPFSCVTFFDKDEKIEISKSSLEELKKALDEKIDPDYFYAIRIDGEFDYVKTRSVTAKKPYRPLVEVVKDQAVFEKSDVKGSLVDIYCPEFIGGINVPGHHFHFISEDRNFGGHVLDVKVKNATAYLDKTGEFDMVLPDGFVSGESTKEAVEAVEKDPEKR